MLCCFDLFFSRIKSLFYYQFESNASDGLQFYAWLILDGGANLLDEHIEASGGKVVLVLYAPESAQYFVIFGLNTASRYTSMRFLKS